MPIYEYQCKACGHKLEALRKISDQPLKKCPECGENTLQKLVSAAAFRLKGGGWYETDFKSKEGQKNLAKGDEAPAESGDKKKDTSETTPAGEAKSETKKESKAVDSTGSGSDSKPAKTEKSTKKESTKKADE